MEIHIARGGQQIGPLSVEETRRRVDAGELQLSDLAWTEGQADWVPLSSLPGFTAAGSPPPVPARVPARAPQGQRPAGGGATENSGLAIASLVCGILSITFLPFISSIPAIICGHMARSRVAKSGGTVGGAGLALAGLIMGYISGSFIFLAILAGIALPVFGQVQTRGMETKLLSNAKQIGVACKLYALDHDGAFPADLEALVPKYVHDRGIFVSPFAPSEPMGFIYYGGKDTDPGQKVLLVSKPTRKSKRRVVLHVDTSGSVVPSATLALPER